MSGVLRDLAAWGRWRAHPGAGAWVSGLLALLVLAAPAPGAGADSLLADYLAHMTTLRASFLQTLVDAHGREIDRAHGTLIVARPGRFSWTLRTGSGAAGHSGEQRMVADGRNLWFYDPDLAQVTVKPLDAALSATPALLLSGTVDLGGNFRIQPAGSRDGLEWVLVEPTGKDADFRNALFGFAKGELRRMILEDRLGQTATIVFEKVERNGPVRPEEVSFTPPHDADIIGTPR